MYFPEKAIGAFDEHRLHRLARDDEATIPGDRKKAGTSPPVIAHKGSAGLLRGTEVSGPSLWHKNQGGTCPFATSAETWAVPEDLGRSVTLE